MSRINKFFSLKELGKKIAKSRKKKQKIVFTNGCFDIIHSGHIWSLERAKSFGDILIVALNTDASVRRLKGKGRPFFPLKERSKVLGAFECVDCLVSFNNLTPISVIKAIKPDIVVKGSDYQEKEIVGSEFVKSYGGKVKRIPVYKNYSTSRIIKKISKDF